MWRAISEEFRQIGVIFRWCILFFSSGWQNLLLHVGRRRDGVGCPPGYCTVFGVIGGAWEDILKPFRRNDRILTLPRCFIVLYALAPRSLFLS